MTPVPTRCRIVPPYVLEAIVAFADPRTAARAQRTLQTDGEARWRRIEHSMPQGPAQPAAPPEPLPAPAVAPGPRRTVSDARHTQNLPGIEVRGEGAPATGDAATDEAYDGLGHTWSFYEEAYRRDSLDGRGMPLLATVHYGQHYDNAFWNGTRMVFGDGDGRVFQRFTRSVDVIGHELTHGVTELTAGLAYRNQPGALNESISDAFGVLVKQRALGQTADRADWLVGAELFTPQVHGVALRSMKSPGTAYDDPMLGKDPQPAHMRDYVTTTDDNGGVHINSGVPNRAFYLVASAIGGYAWEVAGALWYAVLTGEAIRPDCDFATFADLTAQAARQRHGTDSDVAAAVVRAWEEVGVLAPAPSAAAATPSSPGSPREEPSPEPPGPDPEPGPMPSADSELRLRRTGGFAGMVRERTVLLGELPEPDTRDWQLLLSRPGLLNELAQGQVHPDAFCYGVQCYDAGVDVQIPEPSLTPDLRTLFDRTLNP